MYEPCISVAVNVMTKCILLDIPCFCLFAAVPRWEFLPKDLFIKVTNSLRPLPRNNEMQEKAIRKALTEAFTLIQGPPGIVMIKNNANFIQSESDSEMHTVLVHGYGEYIIVITNHFLGQVLSLRCRTSPKVAYPDLLKKCLTVGHTLIAIMPQRKIASHRQADSCWL